MRKDSILQNFYNSKLSKAKNGGPVDRNGKPNLSQIIEGNKDKTSHITRKVKTSLPKKTYKKGGTIISTEGYKQGPPPPGSHYRIPSNTLYNPTPYRIKAVASTGQTQILNPFDKSSVNFPGASHVDEYPMMQNGGLLPLAQFGCNGKSCTQTGDGIKKVGVRDQPEPQGNGENYVAPSNAPVSYDELVKYIDDQYTDKPSIKRRKSEYAQAAQLYPGLTENDFYAAQAEAFRINQRVNDTSTWDKPENQTYDRAWYPYYRSMIQPGVKVNPSQILKFISGQPGGVGGYRQIVESNYGLKKNKFGGGMFPRYHSYAPPRMNNGGGLLSRTVTCSNCGHSWKGVTGGLDPLTCHNCGGMIKMQQGGTLSSMYINDLDYFNPNFKFNEMGGRITTSAMNLRKYVNGGALCKDMFGNTIDCPPGYTAGSTVFATQTPNVSSSTSAGVPQRNAGMLNDLRARQSFQNQASVGPARMQTLDEQKLNQQRKQQFVQNNSNTQLNGQNVIVSRNPDRGFQGQPLTPNAKRWDKGLGHITTGLEAAGYLTGAGAGINALRNKLGKQVSTLALTEEEMAQAMAEGIDEAGSYGISPDQYRKMLQDQQLRQQTGKMVRGMEKNASDQHPIDEWFRSSNTREFGDEMRGPMRKLGYEPTNPKDVENFRNFFNQRSGQLFLNDQKPVGYGQTLTNMFTNPMNRYGGSINQYGPGGQITDGCGPGYSKSPWGGCMPNGWVAPIKQQAGPTKEAVKKQQETIANYQIKKVIAELRADGSYIEPNQGQQATVGVSRSDEPWRKRQVENIKRDEAMKNSELAQTFAGLTPSGDINAGVIGANTFVNMTPGIGIIPASARLATLANSVGPNNPRKGENAYYSSNNSFGENALGALNFAGDIGMLGIGSPFKGASVEPTPGVTQAGFNPIRGAKKFINKAYNSMDEMFGGSGDEVFFSDIKNNSSKSPFSYETNNGRMGKEAIIKQNGQTYIVSRNNPNQIAIDHGGGDYSFIGTNDPMYSKIKNTYDSYHPAQQVEPTYPFRNQVEIEHNGKKFYLNKDNPTEIFEAIWDGTIERADNVDIPRVQEKYSATLPKETTPAVPEPVQQTVTQQPAAPAQTPPLAPKPLNENLNSARAQSNPTPPPSPTEKNTGQPAPAPATPPKKGMGFGQVVKPILKGAGVLGGIGLGMYGMNKIYSNSTPPTKPFTNGPTNNTVAPSDTNFYGTPQVDTSMNQYADTTTAPVIIDSNINAPLTQEEIRQALDTSGIHRYGGQRMEEGGRPKPNLRLPQFQSYRPSYGVNPYIYNERPNPNVNVFGAGLQGFGQVAPRVGINAGINMQRVSTPDFSGWQKPNYNVGMSYRFQNGGSISIEGLQNALNNIKI